MKNKIDFRNHVWVTRDGNRIKLHKLTDNHLLAIVNLIAKHQMFVGLNEQEAVKREYEYRMKRRKEPNTIIKEML